MKTCLIAQIYNEEHRILDWIKYHKKIGIDRILIYDDLSIDNTKKIVNDIISTDTSVSLICSDKTQVTNIYYNSGNDYACNEDLYQRICRSYNNGLHFIKNEWNTKQTIESEDDIHIVFFLDVDEYLVPCDDDYIKQVLSDINFKKYDRFLIPSFDMKPPPSKKFIKNVPVYLQSNQRWSENTRFNKTGEFKGRTKICVLANRCDSIGTSVHSGDIRTTEDYHKENVKLLSDKINRPDDTLMAADKNKIRIFHFRDFPQAESINLIYDEEDNSIIQIMENI